MCCEQSLKDHNELMIQTTTLWSPLRKIRHQEARLAHLDLPDLRDHREAHPVEEVEGMAQAASWQR